MSRVLIIRHFLFLTGHILGKELNKLKNKGVLVGAEDDKQSAYGPEESIAEGESSLRK